MFRCQNCGKNSRRGSMIVLKTRGKTYEEKRMVDGKPRMVPVGEGQEIALEQRWCEACLDGERTDNTK